VDLTTPKEKEILKKQPQLKISEPTADRSPTGSHRLKHRPVVVGTGPCGLFAALLLAQSGYQPIILERGKQVDERVKDIQKFWETGDLTPNSNVQFGEGGAGTFSDGKLTTQIKNKNITTVLEAFVAAGAPETILYKSKPHIGTDILRKVVKNMRQTIEALGGTFLFETCLTNLKIEDGRLKAVELNHEKWLPTDVCILAIGHSARDTFEMLYEQGVKMQQKPFAMGMRIEHPQTLIDAAQYKAYAGHPKLGPAEYKLVHHAQNGRAVYSFCMCPGGYVVASASEEGGVVTNGMSEYSRDGENANSAILVSIRPQDFGSAHPLAGVALQRQLERLGYTLGGETYQAPAQRVGDFLKNTPTTAWGKVKPTYLPGVVMCNLAAHLPAFMVEAITEAMPVFERKIKGFADEDAVFTGFETRSSSPVTILRNLDQLSNIFGLYPAGEGAGYAGGITSAAVDGIEVAHAIMRYYAPLEKNKV
jgi:hypothetical protein